MNNLNKTLREHYLDFFNNYLTIEKFAEHQEMPVNDAVHILDIGRRLHEGYIIESRVNVDK